jgi:uncharacterized Rmd1/YagE family protein
VKTHQFAAVAFEENLSLRDLAPAFPEARLSPRELRFRVPEGEVFIYPFGAMVFHDVPIERREAELKRLRIARPGLTTKVVRESFSAREERDAKVGLEDGTLIIDELSPPRAAVVALIVGQSAAMEYYEQIVEELFRSTAVLVEPLERRGTVSVRTRRLHRFIGQAIATRSEVVSVLYLLDKPDATWDDAAMDLIYDDLRAEFDLVDRYSALESKLTGVQDALELILDVARDRRLLLLEATMAVLVLIELVVSVLQLRGH